MLRQLARIVTFEVRCAILGRSAYALRPRWWGNWVNAARIRARLAR